MRAALVTHDGVVVNIVEIDPDSEFNPGGDLEVVDLAEDSPAAAGWLLGPNDVWTPPPAAEPTEPTPRDAATVMRAEIDELADIVIGLL